MKLLLAPHDDDTELFAAFTAIRVRPQVVICFDSYVQASRGLPITAERRMAETYAASRELGLPAPGRLSIRDDHPRLESELRAILIELYRDANRVTRTPQTVYAPAVEIGGHPHHNTVGRVAAELWPGRVIHYLTYTDRGKSTNGIEVLPEHDTWIACKLHAMACHLSQMTLDPRCGCWPHFLWDCREFYQR